MTEPPRGIGWRRALHRVAAEAELAADRTRYRLLPPRLSRLTIQAYRGFGTPSRVRLRGRVLADAGIAAATDTDSAWQRTLNALRRFESDEMPGARVGVRFAGTSVETVADDEGHFAVELAPTVVPYPGWQTAELTLLEPRPPGGRVVERPGPVIVTEASPPLVIVSDLDDTVIRTGVGSLVHMLRGLLLGSARTRSPFPGVAALYRALHAGPAGSTAGPVPIVYLSSSPWNLYDLLEELFALRGIPLGPILLRDWGLDREHLLGASHQEHKLGHILDLLAFFGGSRFLLIGDSGQHDPEIYAEAARRHPGRIAAVYIRDVSLAAERDSAVDALAPALREAGTDLVRAADTVAMATHAAARGWIAADTVAAVAAESAEPA